MFKLFSLTLITIFSFIVTVQCGGRGIPPCPTATGPRPSSHIARGAICVFKCPETNVQGNNLSSSIHDSVRLNCRYIHSTGIQTSCVYNKYTGELLNIAVGSKQCPVSALFYCPRTGMTNDKKRNNISYRSPIPKYFQARTKLGRANKVKRGDL